MLMALLQSPFGLAAPPCATRRAGLCRWHATSSRTCPLPFKKGQMTLLVIKTWSQHDTYQNIFNNMT